MAEPLTEPRWRRLPEERPRQIIEAALAIFGDRGLAAARLEDIAKRAGLSKGTIYLYFPNKEELFREVIRSTVVSRIAEREQAFLNASGSAVEVLTEYTRAYWKFIRSSEFAPIFRLVHAEIHNFPDLAAFYVEEVVARSHRLVEALVKRGIDTGEFRDIDPRVAARLLGSTFVMHGLWCTHRNVFSTVATKTDDEVFDEVFDFFLHALRPRDPSDLVARAIDS
jgi:AcrR family transcriptional regulator